MNCGPKYNLSYPQASRTHWGVIAHEWMIAKRWMRFSIVYEQDVNGKRSMPQGSVQAAAPIGVFRNGPEQVFFGCYGCKVYSTSLKSATEIRDEMPGAREEGG
jgi:hypothetical protein